VNLQDIREGRGRKGHKGGMHGKAADTQTERIALIKVANNLGYSSEEKINGTSERQSGAQTLNSEYRSIHVRGLTCSVWSRCGI